MMPGAEPHGASRRTARDWAAARLGGAPLAVVAVLIAAPNLAFLLTHLANPALAVLSAGLGASALLLVLRNIGRSAHDLPLDGRLLAICCGVALVFCLLGGQGHLFFANDDWLIRDAVLADLVAQPWPVGYEYRGDATFLRAPLGLYLVPALVGKAFGLQAAHLAVAIQNAALFGSVFYVLASAFVPRARAAWVVAVFLLFSGWDVIGAFKAGQPLHFGAHLEWWAGNLQFSSHVTQLFWVPNHAAAGWAFVAAYLAWHRRLLSLPSLVTVFGFCVFWSPLAAVGALPFLLRAVLLRPREINLAAFGQVALGIAALAPIALFLGADSGRVAHGFQAMGVAFLLMYIAFLTLEIGPVLLFLRHFPPGSSSVVSRGELILVIAILLFVPLYQVGASDFVMRASIPALALLAISFAECAWPVGAERSPRQYAAAALVLAVGAMTPLYELGRAVLVPAFASSDCNLLTAARFPPNNGPLFHYLARVDAGHTLSGVLAMPSGLLRAEDRPTCWPDRMPPGAAQP